MISDTLDGKIAKKHEEIELEKRKQLIQFIIEVVGEATIKEFYETKEQEKEI